MRFLLKNFWLLITIVTLCACQRNSIDYNGIDISEEENVGQNFTYDIKTVKDSILLLNNDLKSNQTRGFLKSLFSKGLKVFFADCYGAIKGMIKGDNVWQSATGSSLNSVKNQAFFLGIEGANALIDTRANAPKKALSSVIYATDALNSKETALSGLILSDTDSIPTAADSIGYYHNSIIYETVEAENNAQYWTNVSEEEALQKLNAEIKKYVSVEVCSDTTISKETIDFCSFMGEISASCNNVSEMITEVEQKYPETNELFDVLTLYLQGMELVSTEEEWLEYCESVIRIISNSNISDAQKETLKAGIIVGYASTKLWNIEEDEEEE